MKLTLEEIAQATGGTLVGENVEITKITTNSLEADKGALFVPIIGERFDGHCFIQNALEGGAVAVLSSNDKEYDCPCVRVKDTRLALGDIAKMYRRKFDIPVVAITGSVGKTTTKDIIASVLSQKYNTLKTEGNFNNDIGVPLTLFRLEEDNECAVVEMGMNHFDEISYLSSVAEPNIAVITNVGVSHIENLGSRDGILKAKCEVFDHMSDDSLKVLNGDDDKLITIKDKYKNICFFSMNEHADIYADNIVSRGIDGISCTIHKDDISFDVDINVPGRHMVSNALAAAAVALNMGLSPDEIKRGIETFKPTKMRMDIIKTDKYTIVNDVYNANPQSVMAAIDVIKAAEGVSCCVLGDMLELGEKGPELHRQTGEYAARCGTDVIVCIGDISENTYNGAKALKNNNVYYFKTQEEFWKKAESIIPDKATVLVKASRGMHFEKTTEKLRGDL